MSRHYTPTSVPNFRDINEIRKFLDAELKILQAVINIGIDRPFEPKGSDQTKFIDGMTIYADGTNFNPGAGRGLYIRNNAQWQKL